MFVDKNTGRTTSLRGRKSRPKLFKKGNKKKSFQDMEEEGISPKKAKKFIERKRAY